MRRIRRKTRLGGCRQVLGSLLPCATIGFPQVCPLNLIPCIPYPLTNIVCILVAVFIPLMVLVRKAGSVHSAGSFDDVVDNAVADHYRSLGAILDAKVGRACQHCIRGLISTKNIRQGDALFILPMKLVYFLNGEFTSDSQMGGKNLEVGSFSGSIMKKQTIRVLDF